jgi:hypothetical protein
MAKMRRARSLSVVQVEGMLRLGRMRQFQMRMRAMDNDTNEDEG